MDSHDLTRPDRPRMWVSGHLFFDGRTRDACDRVILDVVEPFVEESTRREWVRSFFFVRYWELGTHVRVRLCVDGGPAEAVKLLFEDYVMRRLPRELRTGPSADLPPHAQRTSHESLVWVPYVPERDRYGGPYGVAIAEDLFASSAVAAFRLLRRIAAESLDRHGMALALTLTLLAAMVRDTAESAAVARLHSVGFRRGTGGVGSRDERIEADFERAFDRQAVLLTDRIRTWWEAARAGELTPPLTEYSAACVDSRRRLEELVAAHRLFDGSGAAFTGAQAAIRALAPSYLHLTNNRLGVANLDETFLTYAICRVLVGPLTPSHAGSSNEVG